MSHILTSVFLLQETESLKLVADVGRDEDNQDDGSNNLVLEDNENNDESVATNMLQLSPDSVEKVLQEIESSSGINISPELLILQGQLESRNTNSSVQSC